MRASLEEKNDYLEKKHKPENCCKETFDYLRLVDEKMNTPADPITAIVKKETYKELGKRNSHNT